MQYGGTAELDKLSNVPLKVRYFNEKTPKLHQHNSFWAYSSRTERNWETTTINPCIYFTYVLFSNVVGSSKYTAPNNMMIIELWIGTDVDGRCRGLT
jgi:hypothetical protein